jgi:hypothetical protein
MEDSLLQIQLYPHIWRILCCTYNCIPIYGGFSVAHTTVSPYMEHSLLHIQLYPHIWIILCCTYNCIPIYGGFSVAHTTVSPYMEHSLLHIQLYPCIWSILWCTYNCIPIYGGFSVAHTTVSPYMEDSLQSTTSLPTFQRNKVTCRISQGSSVCWLLPADYFIGLLFYPEDGGIMLLRNICELLLTYRSSHPLLC